MTVSHEIIFLRKLNSFEISVRKYSIDDIMLNEMVSQKANFTKSII